MVRSTPYGVFDANVKATNQRVRPVWWSDKWIPFVSSGSGHLIVCDLDPVDARRSGQVVLFLHDDEKRFVLADSIEAWLDAVARDLAAGVYGVANDAFVKNGEAFMPSALEGRDLFRRR